MQKDFAYVKKCLSLEFYVQRNTSYSILDTIADEKETQEVFSKHVHSFSETFLLLLVRASPQFFPFPVTALWTEIAQRGNGWNVSFQNCWTPCLCPEGTLTFLNSNLHSPLDVAPALSSPFSRSHSLSFVPWNFVPVKKIVKLSWCISAMPPKKKVQPDPSDMKKILVLFSTNSRFRFMGHISGLALSNY